MGPSLSNVSSTLLSFAIGRYAFRYVCVQWFSFGATAPPLPDVYNDGSIGLAMLRGALSASTNKQSSKKGMGSLSRQCVFCCARWKLSRLKIPLSPYRAVLSWPTTLRGVKVWPGVGAPLGNYLHGGMRVKCDAISIHTSIISRIIVF